MQRKIALIAAVILGVIAIILLNQYLTQQKQAYEEKVKEMMAAVRGNQRQVLVAKEDILRGAVIKSSAVEFKSIPANFVQPMAATSLERILGMVAVVPIAKGEQITLSKLSYPSQLKTLSMSVPVGKRAITVYLDNIASVGGMINPGDYVDVVSVIPIPAKTADGKVVNQAAVIPLFQKVLVLAVGRNTTVPHAETASKKRNVAARLSLSHAEEQKRSYSRQGSHYITLALSPEEANYVALVQQQGKIQLVLRSPADAAVQPAKPANIESLLKYLGLISQKPHKSPAKATVEVYRGSQKEIVTLEK